jgi:phenylpropionate dioxygenase-like ring-hydroxylating dioxygenase large terminal subunit
MLSAEDNDLITHTGPGTPGGDLFRRYWQPVALAEELPIEGAPIPVRLLGEELALFRDESGSPGLIGLHCPHRGADMSYGRLEDGGLRCIYHGWLFDRHGNCLEQPGEPAGSTYYQRIHTAAYPCQEAGRVIFAYLGPGEPPLLPAYEFLTIPDDQCYATKAFHNCNYLQGNEGNIDPAHLSYLHRMYREGGGWARSDTVPGGDVSSNTLFGRDPAPTLEVEETDFGLRIFALRAAGRNQRYLRVSNFILPNLATFPGGGNGDGYSVNWHVPIDDHTHWKYTFTFTRSGAVDRQAFAAGREITSDYRLVRNQGNRYLQDREEMKDRTFSGVGTSFVVHDACVTETMGSIQDRAAEHLGATDKAIVLARRQLLKAIHDVRNGQEAPHVVRDVLANRFPLLGAADLVVPSDADWRSCWKEAVNHGADLRTPTATRR